MLLNITTAILHCVSLAPCHLLQRFRHATHCTTQHKLIQHVFRRSSTLPLAMPLTMSLSPTDIGHLKQLPLVKPTPFFHADHKATHILTAGRLNTSLHSQTNPTPNNNTAISSPAQPGSPFSLPQCVPAARHPPCVRTPLTRCRPVRPGPRCPHVPCFHSHS